MSLHHRQRHRLHLIETRLLRSDPQLAGMPGMFGRLSVGQAMPSWEQMSSRKGGIRQAAAGPSMRRGLILDFGGVVTTDFHAALAAFCTREGLPPGAATHALRDTRAGRRALAEAECGRISQRELEITLAGLIGADDRGLLARALADLRPRRLVLDLAARTRARGIRVAVLSNSLGRGSYNLYRGYDLDGRFDAVVISDRVGLRKPDPAIYRLTVAKLGVPATSCVFADDTDSNLRPAKALGMAVVLFNDAAAAVAEIDYLLDRPCPR
jgi:epoxide hydrolase-like predicted phosphatase